jgi:ATP-dependent Zn protease
LKGIEVPNLDITEIEMIFKIHTKDKPLSNDVDLKNISEITKGFRG